MRGPRFTVLACFAVAMLTACAATPPDTAAAHVTAALAVSADAAPFCPDPTRPAANAAQARQNSRMEALPPTRVFDNLYYLGGYRNTGITGAWALVGDEGVILINALTEARYAESIIADGLRAVGVDPARIRYVVIAHGHSDQYGGAQYLAEKYGARRVMAEADWASLDEANKDIDDPASKLARRPDDIVLSGPAAVTLGDLTVAITPTPGHTLGTVSMLLPIRHKGRSYAAMLWGGGGQQDVAAANADAESFLQAGLRARAAAFLTGRLPREDDAKLARLREAPTSDNPFFYGGERVRRLLRAVRECRRANQILAAAP